MKSPVESRLESRRKKLQKIAGPQRLESLAGPRHRPSPAAATTGAALESFADDAVHGDEVLALTKLHNGDFANMSSRDLRLTEAVIEREGRQVAFISKGIFEDLPDPWTHFNNGGFRRHIELAIPSIGRVERISATGRSTQHIGTGFIVGERLMMTNRHVAEVFIRGVGTRDRLAFLPGSPGALDFGREKEFDPTDLTGTLKITGMRMIHPFWDMALLEIDSLPDGIVPLRLSAEAPEDLVDRDIAIVGYPGRGNDRSPEALELEAKNFGNIFGVKRIAPGNIDGRRDTLSFQHSVPAMIHDASTLAGNSGSALVDPASGLVHGLHFKGMTLDANFSVPMFELARDRRVAELLKFERNPGFTDEWEQFWRDALLEDSGLIQPRTPGVRTPAAGLPSRGAASTAPATAGAATLTIPLTISVSLGQSTAGAGAGAGAASAAPSLEAFQIPIMYDGLEERAGYEPGFLQLPDGGEIPLPVITPAGKAALALQANGEAELKYHHFSVFMHAQRRLALFTAANVDWRMEKRLVNGEKPSREDLTGIPKNQNIMEQWVTDDRLPAEAQLPDSFFTNDRGAFDKGHLVRREDAAWGESFEDMQMANGDTYYTTNCSPQVRGYNQASLGDLNWGDLENLVQKQAAGEKVMVFSGPVFGTQDRIFFGKDDSGPVKVKIPREFWKIIVARTADGVKAYGFLLKQDLSGVRFREEEFVVPEEWQPQHKPIAAIEAKLSGLLDLSWFKQRDAHDGNGQ